jgi:hypothetical protein
MRRKFLILCFLVLSVVLILDQNYIINQEEDTSEITFRREFRSAEYCSQCHTREYEEWLQSSHSRSLINENFQKLFQRSIEETSGETRRICLRCHSPAAVFNNDLELKDNRNAQPVSCEICHSLLSYDSNYELVFDTTSRMFATREANMGPGHNVVRNMNITTSKMCTPCHTLEHPDQKYLTCSRDISYDKWREITGRTDTCQDCHMRDSFGNIDHSFPGGNSESMVEGALQVRWNLTITNNEYKARIILHNPDVGHDVPAGMTLRRLIIRVSLLDSDEGEIYKQEAFLGRIYEDKDGIWPVMGWKAERIKFDNSIAPLEKRMIMFNMPLHSRARYILLEIIYSHHPNDEDTIPIYTDRKRL